jgi:hypothetical protein
LAAVVPVSAEVAAGEPADVDGDPVPEATGAADVDVDRSGGGDAATASGAGVLRFSVEGGATARVLLPWSKLFGRRHAEKVRALASKTPPHTAVKSKTDNRRIERPHHTSPARLRIARSHIYSSVTRCGRVGAASVCHLV